MSLLPDAVLQGQICSECYQYLSVAPISITASGDKVCGRCLPDLKKSGVKYFTSLFSTAVEDVLFKCVNHFDGCQKTLTIHEAADHEKICVASQESCFFCSFYGNKNQIINHCYAVHPDKISKTEQLVIELEQNPSEMNRVFIVDDINIILVNVKNSHSKLSFIISSENQLRNDIIPYSVRFFSPSDNKLSLTEFNFLDLSTKNYLEKDIDTLISYFGQNQEICVAFSREPITLCQQERELMKRMQDIKKQKEFLVKRESNLNKLEKSLAENSEMITLTRSILKNIASSLFNCQNCHKICYENSYFCPRRHCYCNICLKSWCTICQMLCDFSELPEDFSKLKVQCDWPTCSKIMQISEYLKHTQDCDFRPIRCPLINCDALVYSIQGLKDHWHCQTPSLVEDAEIICEGYDKYEYFWLLNGDLYHILIHFQQDRLNALIDAKTKSLNKASFKCYSYCESSNMWKQFGTITDFCGKILLSSSGCYDSSYGTYYTRVKFVQKIDDQQQDARRRC